MFTIRNERPGDWEAVETLTRRAFYNQYIPGCMEHYLVHIMRGHEDFIPELDFVAELDRGDHRQYYVYPCLAHRCRRE